MKPIPEIPGKCLRAWDTLHGRMGEPDAVRSSGGWWRIIDLIRVTGHSCEGRKLRQLAEYLRESKARGIDANWELESEERKTPTGTCYKVWRIAKAQQSLVQGTLDLGVKPVFTPDWRTAP